MQITDELNIKMHPKNGKVYGGYSMPSSVSKLDGKIIEMQWTNPDAQYVLKLDFRKGRFTGVWYHWNEKTEEWDDMLDEEMTDLEILAAIEEDELLMVER